MAIPLVRSTITLIRSWLEDVTEVEFLRHRKRLGGLSRDQEMAIRMVLLPSLVERLARPLEVELQRQPSERATQIASVYRRLYNRNPGLVGQGRPGARK
jgi:hypothetical protein